VGIFPSERSNSSSVIATPLPPQLNLFSNGEDSPQSVPRLLAWMWHWGRGYWGKHALPKCLLEVVIDWSSRTREGHCGQEISPHHAFDKTIFWAVLRIRIHFLRSSKDKNLNADPDPCPVSICKEKLMKIVWYFAKRYYCRVVTQFSSAIFTSYPKYFVK
jgi:hypothetical protein